MRARNAFTLIELMIVVAIVAVLAAIIIPNFIRARAQSQLAACESNETNLDRALEMYATDNNGNYPPPSGTALPAPSTHSWNSYIGGVNPVCPTNSAAYVYTQGANFSSFTISQGPAGVSVHSLLGVPGDFPQYDSRQGLTP